MSQKFQVWRVKRQAMKKMPLTAEEKARWALIFHDTWRAIGGDVEQALRFSHVRLTKAILVETVCDCNYVETYGGMTRNEYEFMSVCYQRPSFRAWLKKELNYV